MPVKIDKLPDDPILVLTYKGHLDVETAKSAFAQSAALASKMDGPVYRISDVRQAQGDFIDLMQIMAQVRAGVPGSSTDPKIKGVFVGTHHMARLYADLLRQEQFGGVQIPFFKTLEEAMDYIQVEQGKMHGIADPDAKD